MVKEMSPKPTTALTEIANYILKLKHFSITWKEATVKLLPEAGKSKNRKANYQPITLLPSLEELIEKSILTRIKITLQYNASTLLVQRKSQQSNNF